MINVAQTMQAAIQAPPGLLSSCTPHLKDGRYHIHFADFKAICYHKVSSDALRAFETMTDNRIAKLRRDHRIPESHLPHEDDLWLEVGTLDLDYWTLHVRDQSTYWFCLQEESWPGRAKSLLELGFLRRRFVARAGRAPTAPAETAMYQDDHGYFLIVDDEQGNYTNSRGELHSAFDEGYTVLRRQYLYCIDAVNAALAKLGGLAPPTPLPPWRSIASQRTKKSAALVASETTKSTDTHSASANESARLQSARLGGTKATQRDGDSFAFQNNTLHDPVSANSAENLLRIREIAELRNAPWTPETLLALCAALSTPLFPVPTQLDDDTWNRDWAEPAQQLIDQQCAHMDPSRAWEIIERHVCAMISGPTWYARDRTNMTKFSLRHVMSNWKNVESELRKEPWAPAQHIEYVGSYAQSNDAAQSSYAQGYVGSAQCANDDVSAAQDDEQCIEVIAQPAQIDARATKPLRNEDAPEVVESAQCAEVAVTAQSGDVTQGSAQSTVRKRRTQGMRMKFVAQNLGAQIHAAHPLLHVEIFLIAAQYVVSIETAQEQWYDFAHPDDYHEPTAQTLASIAQAEHYAAQRIAASSNGPPGEAWGGDE